MTRDVSRAVRKSVDAEHICVFVFGHNIPHLHIWVIPRYLDTPREFWGFKMFEWPDRPTGGQEEVEKTCASVRSLMD